MTENVKLKKTIRQGEYEVSLNGVYVGWVRRRHHNYSHWGMWKNSRGHYADTRSEAIQHLVEKHKEWERLDQERERRRQELVAQEGTET